MRYGFVARLRVCVIALAVVGASLSVLAAAASAETYSASSTAQFEEAVSKANANPGANTIVLAAGSYLPGATITLTNTSGLQTIEGPSGSVGVVGGPAALEGTNVQPAPSELFVLEPGVSVTFKNVEIIHGGGSGVPAIRDIGETGSIAGGKLGLESSLVGGNTGSGLTVEPGEK